MRQGLEETRYVNLDGEWFEENLVSFDAEHAPVYRRNPTPIKVDLVGERKQVPITRDADGEAVYGWIVTKHPTHTIDANGRLQPFHPPGQGSQTDHSRLHTLGHSPRIG